MDLFSILTLIGGLVFFLFGMQVMSGSLEKMAGGKLESMLKKATARPIPSMLLGTVITMVIQSSSATTVILVGLVNSGLMQFSQTLYVIFGANIGTTFTAWLLSLSGIESSNVFVQMLKPINFSPILALLGIITLMFSKSDRKRSIGTVGIGFALLMYGMDMMSEAVSPLAQMPGFENALQFLSNPLLGLLAALLFTMVIQSSSAATGILQALSLTGAVSYGMAIPMIMGINIGTCITGIIASIGTNVNARRVAGVHMFSNLIATAVFLPVFWILDSLLDFAFVASAITPWGIAIVHSAFNILLTVMLMPVSRLLVKIITFCIRDKEQKSDAEPNSAQDHQPFLLDERLLRSPSIAISECSERTLQMSQLAHDTILQVFRILYHYDETIAQQILTQEDRLDQMEDRLGTYLVPIGSQALSGEDSRRVASMLHNIGDFERLGDHAVNLLKVSKEMYDKHITFSDHAKRELEVLMHAASEILNMTERAFREKDATLACRVEPLEQVIDKLIARIKNNHINRLCSGDCTIELGFILSDLLTNFERISDHCSNIAVSLIELEHNSFDTHQYLNSVKYGNEDFTRLYDEYQKKFAL